jgi:hypothetical protein
MQLRLPRVLVGVIDPAGRYMERQHPDHHRPWRRRGQPVPRGWAPFTSDGSFPASLRDAPAPPEHVRRQHEELHAAAAAERRARRDALVVTHGQLLADKARELADTGSVVLPTTAGDVRARIVRFHWGDAVLEVSRTSPVSATPASRSTTSLTRLSKQHRDLAAVLQRYLVNAVVRGGGKPTNS